MHDLIMTPVSLGELVDKITILEIKAAKIINSEKLGNVKAELALLADVLLSLKEVNLQNGQLREDLKQVNLLLWDVEDILRDYESAGQFGPDFVEKARSVYKLNDRRARLKKEINTLNGSSIVEEKSYSGQ